MKKILNEAKLSSVRLRQLGNLSSEFQIGIIGDFYLDRYIVGTMESISREAPVPIVKVKDDMFSPGAAGNIAVNMSAWNCQVSVLGTNGADWVGKMLRNLFNDSGINTRFLVELDHLTTPNFNKIYASVPGVGYQQVARFDTEIDYQNETEIMDSILPQLNSFLEKLDAVIIADYTEVPGKGWLNPDFISDVVASCKKRNIPVFATSRQRIHWFRDCYGIVINETELLQTVEFINITFNESGARTLQESAVRIASFLNCDCLYLTLGEKGIWVAEIGAPIREIPTLLQKGTIDVTGAGDTALAAIVAGALAKFKPNEAAVLANLAAGIVIRKLAATGVATVDEIIQEAEMWKENRRI